MREIKVLVDDDTKAIVVTTFTLQGSNSHIDTKAFELPDGVDVISMDFIDYDNLTLEEFLGGE